MSSPQTRSVEAQPASNPATADRRDFLRSAVAAAGATGLVSLAAGVTGCDLGTTEKTTTPTTVEPAADVEILQGALALEHEGIAAYTAFINFLEKPPSEMAVPTGDLAKKVRQIAETYRKHHEAHRDALMGPIKALSGTPVTPKSNYNFGTLAKWDEFVKLAAKIENVATQAYASAVGKLRSRDLAETAARIMAAEAWHTAVLRGALGEDPAPDWHLAKES